MSLSDGVVLAWDRFEARACYGSDKSGWLAFVKSARIVGKGVDCLPMAKPVVRVTFWGSAVG